ncbi:MAG: sodium/solute symporter [Verrucomicrobiae bacterium]|nr:sodium/solute symporter [Verrucomicrobiae bacterium]
MSFPDYATVAVYLLVIIAIGFFCRRHQSRREFFAASGSMGWFVVGLSVMATLFSSNSFVFYPSAAFGHSLRIGLSLVAFTLMTPVVIWIFIPIYARLELETAYEYLEKRFHVSVRTLASGLFVLLRIGWMASATYAASLVIARVASVPQPTVILVLGAVAILYTMLGGLRAVMWTDVVQFFVFAATILLTLGLILMKSDSSVAEVFHTYFAGREGLIVDFQWSMSLKYGSWAILIGIFLESVSAFGVDQVAVQRYLSARSQRESQLGAALNLLGMWIVLPGLLLIGVGLFHWFSVHPGELGAGSLSEILTADPKFADEAMPEFVRLHFPPGLAGLFLAALIAAIMSSIDSGIHSVTTALVVDFRDRLFPSLKPATPGRELLSIRLLIVTIGVLAMGLAFLVGPLGDVFAIGKKLTAAFGGPLLAIFVLAFFFPRAAWGAVLFSVSAATIVTLVLTVKMDGVWFSVWYWPIGFFLSLALGLATGLVFRSEPSEFTWRKIMAHPPRSASSSSPDSNDPS